MQLLWNKIVDDMLLPDVAADATKVCRQSCAASRCACVPVYACVHVFAWGGEEVVAAASSFSRVNLSLHRLRVWLPAPP